MNKNFKKNVLVIDDEAVVCMSIQRILSAKDFNVETEQSARPGIEKALTNKFDIILIDLKMPEIDGLEVLNVLKNSGVTSELVMITGHSTVKTAVEAIKNGAVDYISKPFSPDELLITVQKIFERSAFIRENLSLKNKLGSYDSADEIIGKSRQMRMVYSVVKKVSQTDGTVLITGRSGTGKELIARTIHKLSPRQNFPFMVCDCCSLSVHLLESELFGHVKGAFTGAIVNKQGLFEAAHKGTLFLDEIANISQETQGKLLRAIESHRIKRVGDHQEHQFDIRLVAATNRDLSDLVREGSFREDLLYRLNVVPVNLPSLCERKEDIPELTAWFLRYFCRRHQKNISGFSPEVIRLFNNYPWPGNVRELKNIIERIVILHDVATVEPCHLPREFHQEFLFEEKYDLPSDWEAFKQMKNKIRESAVDNLEKKFLLKALDANRGNVSKASKYVGMQRTNFHSLLRKHGIT
ncbi:MAG: sigma-54-dependent Fis family transcriptional regulator [Deltaproteobacteria bacterium]|nr:sigma-54-dependent Fis family transcriptional regulator [Deltaproteobacteria bacterium]